VHHRVLIEAYGSGVRVMLGEQVMSNLVLTLPLLDGCQLIITWLGGIQGTGTLLGTIEVAPTVSGLHGLVKMH
jgi:hypothetical protein